MKKNKYNLNDFVWFIRDNKIQHDRITEISVIEEIKNNISNSEYLYKIGVAPGIFNFGTDILYERRKPISGQFSEEELFTTKKDLINSL